MAYQSVQTSFMEDRDPRPASGLPASVVHHWINLVGLACLMAVLAAVVQSDLPAHMAASILLLAYALPIIVLDLSVAKVHRRRSTGLDWTGIGQLDARRVAVKLLGLIATLAVVVAAHALTGLYDDKAMRTAGFFALYWAPIAAPFLIGYFALIDRAMAQPEDGYWHTGRLLLGRWNGIDWTTLRAHAMGWLVKGFFLPIMIVYLLKSVAGFQAGLAANESFDLLRAVNLTTRAAIIMELVIVCVGYTCTMRLLDSHIRSTNPFLLGWLVTLVVYEPFNRVVTGQVFVFRDGMSWYDWFGNSWLAWPWAAVLLLTFFTWLWATAIFGIRWSNLTNRGIITNGPYRWTKHPDYTSKVVFFWFGNVPFLSALGHREAISGTVALIVVSAIYFGRARMEEKHLSEEPDYRAYALAMNEKSIFAPLGRLIPALRYRPPAS